MIPREYYIYDVELDLIDSTRDEDDARRRACQYAQENEVRTAVMLQVPVSEFPELRVIAVFEEETGRCAWETNVYDSELVG